MYHKSDIFLLAAYEPNVYIRRSQNTSLFSHNYIGSLHLEQLFSRICPSDPQPARNDSRVRLCKKK